MYITDNQLLNIRRKGVERYGIIMHTSYLPTGQRSRFKEAIQMQISSDMKPQEAT